MFNRNPVSWRKSIPQRLEKEKTKASKAEDKTSKKQK
jgi:hypothetical protein